MTEFFDALTVAGETVSEEDRIVYLLASLPKSYNVLMTALEANENVPKLEVVIERIVHQERKSKDRNCFRCNMSDIKQLKSVSDDALINQE